MCGQIKTVLLKFNECHAVAFGLSNIREVFENFEPKPSLRFQLTRNLNYLFKIQAEKLPISQYQNVSNVISY